MSLSEKVKIYLSKQKQHKWKIFLERKKHFNQIIVIPALDEFYGLKNLFFSLSCNDEELLNETLILIVVNNSQDSDDRVYSVNQQTLKFLNEEISQRENRLNIGYIDASSLGLELPARHSGAGMARKIGMDLALEYFDYSNHLPKLLICLDADCEVSRNYLQSLVSHFILNPVHAATVEFKHLLTEDKAVNKAIINYEIFLRYYVLGLKYAGSNYAHLSVGSTIVCDADTYMKVGGMNKRKGGEDFYFLNEISKITEISLVSGATVYPAARVSERVPFGTGPRIKRFISGTRNEYLLYSPEIYHVLKKWLKLYSQIPADRNFIYETLKRSKEIDPVIYEFLISRNFDEDWKNIIKNSKDKTQIRKQKLLWMDGFRTLKMIHYLRDNKYENISMFDAVDILLRKMNVPNEIIRDSEIPPIESQLKYLEILRESTNRN